MFLYTIILEFKGGTYISQIRAISERAAVSQWAQSLDEKVSEVALADRQKLSVEFNAENPLALNGTVNAWCASALVNNDLALMNVIKTDDSQ